jgi:hypothetical protein
MRSALALILAAAGAVAASDVVELKKDTFNEFITDHPLVLAECMLSVLSCIASN